jgi:hypothetical protein
MATAEFLKDDQIKRLVREILVEKIEQKLCERIRQRYGQQENDPNGREEIRE